MTIKHVLDSLRSDWFHPIGALRAKALLDYVRAEVQQNPELLERQKSISAMPIGALLRIVESESEHDEFSLSCAYLTIHEMEKNRFNVEVGEFRSYAHYPESSARAYCIGDSYIAVVFGSEKRRYYLYSYYTSGVRAVETLKGLARNGRGLATMLGRKNFSAGKNCEVVATGCPIRER